ncbi:hypothetical protein AB0K16_22555 [Nonomuraea jabiensis]|uniref:hypothetical protein n=1 Tax=Nonomuraea jabiensis TaxID=882448 RepID=UPI003420D6E2
MPKKMVADGGYDFNGSLVNNANIPDVGGAFPLSGYGLVAASGDPAAFLGANSNIPSGQTYFARVWVRAGVPITNLWVAVRTAGVYTTSAVPNQLAIYDNSGNQTGITANNNNLFTSAGWRGGALITPIPAQSTGRFCYIGLIPGGVSAALTVAFHSGTDNNQVAWFNTPVTGGNRRCMWNSGQTALPSSFDPATYGNATTFLPLVGAS